MQATSSAPNLAFDRAPPIGIVLGCLLPAPWLGVATGLLLAFGPHDGLPATLAPLSLALTHLLALGMLLPVMLGALWQMLPVIAGVEVPWGKQIAPFIALLGALTGSALAWGFLGGAVLGFQLALWLGAPLLLLPASLLIVAGRRICMVNATTATQAHIGWPLAFTLLLGGALAGGFAYGWPTLPLLPAHISWGLGGWLLCLLSGVASTVWPMFWQTPRLPMWLEKIWPWLGWLPLLLASLSAVLGLPLWRALGALLLPLCLLALHALFHAKRRHDPVWPLWLASALSLGLAGGLLCWPGDLASAGWQIGIGLLVGCGVLPINAMLGKIVPFLVWLHLRRLLPPRQRVPAMQTIIRPGRQRAQAGLLLLALLALYLLPYAPAQLAVTAGLLFATSQAWLGLQLLHALRRFRQLRHSQGQGL